MQTQDPGRDEGTQVSCGTKQGTQVDPVISAGPSPLPQPAQFLGHTAAPLPQPLPRSQYKPEGTEFRSGTEEALHVTAKEGSGYEAGYKAQRSVVSRAEGPAASTL